MTIGFSKKGLKRIGEKNCRSYTLLSSPCVSLWESRRLGRRRWNFYTYFSSCHLSHKRRRGAAQRVRCNANEWPCHVHAHCNFSFHDCNPHRRLLLRDGLCGIRYYYYYIRTYKYNIIYTSCTIYYYMYSEHTWVYVWVCMCVYTYTFYYIYIHYTYNMLYVGLSWGPLSTYGEMFTFLHPTVTTFPRPFMFVLLWELIIWSLQFSTQILLDVLTIRLGMSCAHKYYIIYVQRTVFKLDPESIVQFTYKVLAL
jgi:hypothetical protein